MRTVCFVHNGGRRKRTRGRERCFRVVFSFASFLGADVIILLLLVISNSGKAKPTADEWRGRLHLRPTWYAAAAIEFSRASRKIDISFVHEYKFVDFFFFFFKFDEANIIYDVYPYQKPAGDIVFSNLHNPRITYHWYYYHRTDMRSNLLRI